MPKRTRSSRATGWRVVGAKTEAVGARTYVVEENLGYLVNRGARLMAQKFARRLHVHGVQLGQWAILLFLYARDGQTQAELARVVAIEPPTVARTIDRMVRDGLVVRKADPGDRRVMRIHLTPRAIALRDELVAESREVNEEAASVLSAAELTTLKTLLRRLIAGLVEDGR